MKEFKGTKGNWVIESGEDGHAIVCGDHVVTQGGCGCCNKWNESIEVEADARLISAAPEMLEALQAFIGWCESQEFSYETISSESAYVNAKSLALAAVSKALGEQQQTKEG